MNVRRSLTGTGVFLVFFFDFKMLAGLSRRGEFQWDHMIPLLSLSLLSNNKKKTGGKVVLQGLTLSRACALARWNVPGCSCIEALFAMPPSSRSGLLGPPARSLFDLSSSKLRHSALSSTRCPSFTKPHSCQRERERERERGKACEQTKKKEERGGEKECIPCILSHRRRRHR